MKIVKAAKSVEPVEKAGTKVGELYTTVGGEGVHFRCQGGFAHMGSGAFTQYEIAREDACWVHLPKAELHLNN